VDVPLGLEWLQQVAAVILLLLTALGPLPATAAGVTIENKDRNNTIEFFDTRQDGATTWLLYATRPVQGQAHFSDKCTANFYLLELQRGLENPEPELLAEHFCQYFGMSGHLLANGDVLTIAGGRVETWRPGNGRVRSWQMENLAPLERVGAGPNLFGSMPVDAARNGDVVLAGAYPRQRQDTITPSGVVTRVSQDGEVLWAVDLDEPGVLINVIEIWAAEDGGAWLHAGVRPMQGSRLPDVSAPDGAQVVGQNRLYRVNPDGTLAAPLVLATDQMLDFSAPPPSMPDPAKDPEAFAAALEASLARTDELTEGTFFGYGDIVGQARRDGGLDLLLGRKADEAELIRVGPDGTVSLRTSLSEAMTAEGLRQWKDFAVADGRAILYGTLGTRRDRLPQGYLSWIDLDSGAVVTRLVPLSNLGLEEAKAAGDEEVQYLEHNPSQQAQLLTMIAGQPLAVSLVYRSRRQAMQLDEGSEQLVVYTEARDQRRAEAAREAQKTQRKADRKARKQAMDADMAAAIGVSEQEYAAMSNRERKEAMVRSGDMGAMMAAAMKQAELAQQQMAAQQGAGGHPGAPGMTPEMAAAIAQAQQAMANAGMTMPGMPSNVPGATAVPPAQAVGGKSTRDLNGADRLPLDANLYGTIEFEQPDGDAVSLSISDRETGEELLRKNYPDGSVYEYLDFGHFQAPLERIAVVIMDEKGQTIRELTPVSAN
jgi:hypothetical protein